MVDSRISEISDSHFVWEIRDFIYVRRIRSVIRSQKFEFNGCSWYFEWIERIKESDDLIRFHIQCIRREFPVEEVSYILYIKYGRGDDYWTSPVLTNIYCDGNVFGNRQHILKSDFDKNEVLITAGGTLSLHLKFYSPTIDTVPPPPQDGLKPTLPIEAGTSTEANTASVVNQTLPDLPSKQSSSSASGETISTKVIKADVGIQTCPELKSKPSCSCSSSGGENVLLHFKELLLNGKKSDVTFCVKGKEFKAHKAILIARSPVFDKMFDHEMVEQTTGSVEITDCEPEDFHGFLLYLYTGKVEEPTVEKAVALYCLADKYNIEELVPYCVQFLLSNLSVECFCDIVLLGLRHSDSELMASANIFFAKHMKQIVVTDKWKSFIIENPAEGNEIFIKALS